MKRLLAFLLSASCLTALSLAGPALAAYPANYPDKPVRYIIPFAPGGESDIGARFQQIAFKKKFGQEMIVESKPGAGGALAWAQTNTFPGDGYTIMSTNLPHIVLQPMEGQVQYKTEDITNVYFYQYTPDAIVVRSESPYKTFQDLVKAAREKPEAISLAGSGTNTANHMAAERFNAATGAKTTYVPFKGTGDLISAVLGGHVSAAMSYVTFAIAQKGKTRVLAVATEKRHPQFPDVPTFKELGIDWVDGAYRGMAVPQSTPADLRKRISDMFAEINRDPEFRVRMAEGGFELVDIPYEKMPAFMAERSKVYTELGRRMGLVK
ncbi:MAG: tripartite tricarboxylate transporter substrate binding protein [Betaproteobacteria bacterium]|nr:tripartite tricarboxylate transporter substrate binding protein [Betaproteobacteria bacterium]